jgi:hypothetical protein
VVLPLGVPVGFGDQGYLLEEVREGTLGRGILAGLGVTRPAAPPVASNSRATEVRSSDTTAFEAARMFCVER